jgi:hypothetical protein
MAFCREGKRGGAFLLLFLALNAYCFPLGSAEQDASLRQPVDSFQTEDESAVTSVPALSLLNPLAPDIVVQKASLRAEQVVKALAEAHPMRIRKAEFKDGDWAVELRGKWYFYTEGRMLPEELRETAELYSPQPFYNYPDELPEWQPPSPENAARYATMTKQRGRGGTARRAQVFYDDLWRIHSRSEAWSQQKTINFLGRKVLVHHAIMEALTLVEQKINEAAAADPQVRQWVSRLETISTWNWRDIADTRTRSNHAYGTAIDLLPSQKNRQETYWLWTAQKNVDWWDVPFSKRMTPPKAVIKAFEAYGFVWGGKWLFYDTMHFEYRPEILLLNGIPLRGEY